MRLLHVGLIVVAGLLGALIGIVASQQGASQMTDEQFNDRVRETMVNNPDILRAAFASLETQTRQAELEALQEAITRNYSYIETSPATFVGGNPDGNVTIVEFFDYECGYCRRALEPFQELVEADGNVRVLLFEMPILGERSFRASLAAVAADRQGLYLPFHDAMVAFSGQLTDEVMFELAAEVGLDVEQLQQDLMDPDIAQRVNANVQFSQAMTVNSTPTYVVGGQVQLGWNQENIAAMVEEARAR